MQSKTIPRALTIAGSDSSAGAGIQADLKTFAALGVYGLSVLTAITAQNTLGVRDAEDVAPTLVEAQIDAVLEDIGADATKTGVLSNPLTVEVVARQVRKWGLRLVVDPVMIATSGAPLLRPEAVALLRSQLLPLAEVVTPNLPEAEVLTGRRVETLDDMRAAASAIFDLGARHVVIKGGHLGQTQRGLAQEVGASPTAPTDIYFDGQHFVELRAERIQTPHTHGTGCTFSAAIAAFLARGMSVEEAVFGAKHYITEAISHAPGLGHGHGPVGHFWQWEHFNPEQVLGVAATTDTSRHKPDRDLRTAHPLHSPVERRDDPLRSSQERKDDPLRSPQERRGDPLRSPDAPTNPDSPRPPHDNLIPRLALHVLVDPEWSRGRDILTIASAAIEGGATVIQLRDKKASTRLLVEEGLALRRLTRERNVLFIVNDRIDVALAVDADGVHIGQDDDMPLQIARRLMSPQRILGVSVGSLDEAVAAVAANANYLSIGPIFSTYAKSDAGPAIGTSMLAELATRYHTPIIGIGGITAQNAGEVLQAGAVGVAVITAVISAEDIVAATHSFNPQRVLGVTATTDTSLAT